MARLRYGALGLRSKKVFTGWDGEVRYSEEGNPLVADIARQNEEGSAAKEYTSATLFSSQPNKIIEDTGKKC